MANFITDRVNETAPKAAAGKAVNTPKLTKAQQQEVVMRVAVIFGGSADPPAH